MNALPRAGSRPHCTCAVVRNYDYDQAAEKLGCKPRFLQDNVTRFIHQHIGERRLFCECELRLIQAARTVVPAQDPAAPVLEDDAPAVTTLRTIRPARARRATSSG
ncbi:hypothetical protein [Streptomyces sp. NBC_00425]|uniref:hypothetical protein n=1 Tax=Streptomyces sp. NBC_00425 TaxID=2975740 RepID=UPI002E1F266B